MCCKILSTYSRASAALHRVQSSSSAVELVYTSHNRWPYPPIGRFSDPTVRISILDSSYNPPTLAHLALAKSQQPCLSNAVFGEEHTENDYHARLLLLSVRNADKLLKAGDASYNQRLEMMRLLAGDITTPLPLAGGGGECGDANVAIAIIDEPTFVGKSNSLLTFLQAHLSRISLGTPSAASSVSSPIDAAIPAPQLTFLLGFDTLVRLFSPQYYASEGDMLKVLDAFFACDGDNCRVVCARRMSPVIDSREVQEDLETKILMSAKEFIESGRVVLIDVEETVRTFSSSEVRKGIINQDSGWKDMVTACIADYITEQGLYSHFHE